MFPVLISLHLDNICLMVNQLVRIGSDRFQCLFVHIGSVMAFPEPRPQAPQLPNHLLRTIDCQQGAIRAVRFNGKTTNFHSKQ